VELAGEAKRRGMGVAGIDLHGDEENFPPGPFTPAFDRAEELGLGLRAHAGEAAGPESVWEAVRELKVPRIGHGVRAVESPVLMEWMRRSGVTLEVCPTSNVRTGAVRDLESHPVRRFYDYGILVTVNSDDPLPFFTNIEREYRLLVDEFAFTCDDLRIITENALRAAFLSQEERQQLLLVVEGAYRTAGVTLPPARSP
jgi:adenosine deaminase